jgi:hypothetical protein
LIDPNISLIPWSVPCTPPEVCELTSFLYNVWGRTSETKCPSSAFLRYASSSQFIRRILREFWNFWDLTTGGNSSAEGMKAFCFAGKPFVGA